MGMRRGDWIWLASIVCFSFVLRIVLLAEWRQCPLFDHPIIDEGYHDRWAQAFASHQVFVDGPYFRAPLYPLFLGSIYRAFGHDYVAPRIIQAVLASIGCGIVFLLGRQLFGRAVAIVAALATATYWILIYFERELLLEPLLTFLVLVLAGLLVIAARRSRGAWRWWAAAGAVLGLAAITRPNVLLFLPFAMAWMILDPRVPRGVSARHAGVLALSCALLIAPVSIRNLVRGHDSVLIASQGGLNFWVGNNEMADGRTANPPGGALDYTGKMFAERHAGRTLKASEIEGLYYRLGREFIREHPGRALALTWLRFRLWWSRWEISNGENIYFWSERFSPWTARLPLRFAFIGPLAVLGLVLAFRRARELFPLWGFTLVYTASFLPFFSCARFRMPVVPILILLGTWGAFELVRAVRGQRSRDAAIGLAALVAGVLLVNVTPHRESVANDFVSRVTLGNVHEDRNEPAKALLAYRDALAIAPRDLQAGAGLASALGTLGRMPEGIADFRRIIEGPRLARSGDSPSMLAAVHAALATGLVQTRQYPEAVEHYRTAIAIDPVIGRGSDQFNLALVLAVLGQGEEADALFEEAVRINPALAAQLQQVRNR